MTGVAVKGYLTPELRKSGMFVRVAAQTSGQADKSDQPQSSASLVASNVG